MNLANPLCCQYSLAGAGYVACWPTMEWLDTFRSHVLTLPNLAKFAVLLALIVGVQALARRFRIPELVGLVVVGLLLGPHVVGLYGANHPIVQFFADLGRLMLMFAVGLEVDINLFRKAQTRSITFGVITTITPQVLGTAYGLAFGYGPLSSSARCSHRTL
jgi:Kef-type K+ transport system membrane component KefB